MSKVKNKRKKAVITSSDWHLKIPRSYGYISTVGDGVASVLGFSEVKFGEYIQITALSGRRVSGIVLNLNFDKVGIAILGNDKFVISGNLVWGSGGLMTVCSGFKLLGQVINVLSESLLDSFSTSSLTHQVMEVKAPGVLKRHPVNSPVQTGIVTIDTLIPIGRGQRELIIGDRKSGKTAIAMDTFISQKFFVNELLQRLYCIYVAIGQKRSSVVQLYYKLLKFGVMDYSIFITATASESATLQYLAPFAGSTLGEFFRDRGLSSLIVYDDLSKHAAAYRQVSLLLRCPPSREAFPGDVFYLHSRLLERSSSLAYKYGGGTLTAFPIIETQLGDISAFIPTNVISITDGQLFLDIELFNEGFRPAISINYSVSRVGSAAQLGIYRSLSSDLREQYLKFKSAEIYLSFNEDVDEVVSFIIIRGRRLIKLLVQKQYQVLEVLEQVILLVSLLKGYFDQFALKFINKIFFIFKKAIKIFPVNIDLNKKVEVQEMYFWKFYSFLTK